MRRNKTWIVLSLMLMLVLVTGCRREAPEAGAPAAAAAGAALVVRAPRTSAVASTALCVAAGALTRWSGGSPREAVAVGTLSPAFGILFGAGVVRGLRLAARSTA